MATYTPNYNLYKPEPTDQFDDFLTEFGNNMDEIDAHLGGGGGSSTLAGLSDVNLTSPTTDDALIYDGAEWVNSPLSAVAFSGDYSDLLNAPTIPTKTSDLNNDSNFVSDASYVHTDNNFTNADVTKLSGIQAGAEVNVQSDWNEADNTADDYIKNKPTIPTNTSDLNNDSGFLDSSDITVTQVQTTGAKIATIDVDGNSTDLYAPTGGGGSKHTILNESGTALADEPNLQFADGLKASDDSGNSKTKVGVDTTFTEAVTRTNIASGDSFSTILGKIKKFFTDLKTVAFSGSYNDLSDKPTIPDISTKVSKSGDNMTGNLTMKGKDVILGTTGSGSNDSGDLVYNYGNGNEKVRIWTDDTYTQALNPNIRVNQSDGTVLRWSRLVSEDMLNTKYLSVFAGRSGASLMPWTADSDMQIDLTPTCERVSADLNTAPIQNRAIFEEYNSNSPNLPKASWYYVLTTQGADTAYACQLAMGMIESQVYYRRKAGGAWFSWKALIPTFSVIAQQIPISALSPNGEVFDQAIAWIDASYRVLGIVGYELSGNNYTRCFICKLSFGESGSTHYVNYSVRNSSTTDSTGALTLTVQLLTMS